MPGEGARSIINAGRYDARGVLEMRWAVPIFVAILAAAAPSAAVAVDYRTDIQPILAKHCYSCHGSLRQKGSLRLDHVSFIRTGGDSGPAIAAAGAESLLVHAIKGTGDIERMPLEAKPLGEEEIAKLEAWVAAGAPAPDEPLPSDPRRHWSFQKPIRPELPTVNNPAWSTSPGRSLPRGRARTPGPDAQ